MKGFHVRSDATTRLKSLPGITRAGSMGVISELFSKAHPDECFFNSSTRKRLLDGATI
jgi:hypothetical protein